MIRLPQSFFSDHPTKVGPALIGKLLHHTPLPTPADPHPQTYTLRILETEAYCGPTDSACHASKGKTPRTKVLWEEPGTIYLYLCYGIHWLLNVVCEGDGECVLIRACVEVGSEGAYGVEVAEPTTVGPQRRSLRKRVAKAVITRRSKVVSKVDGPGKLTRHLHLPPTYNGLNICKMENFWVEDDKRRWEVIADTRVGIAYAAKKDQAALWRYRMGSELPSPIELVEEIPVEDSMSKPVLQ
ncbi:Methylpurine-DNA glycosylase [Gaertneriomyces semiglobifer]|nr:Methylpurine-DNA glycosylase [Gaertneriomyces semiglobifer]